MPQAKCEATKHTKANLKVTPHANHIGMVDYAIMLQELPNTLFCPLQEKFHTVFLTGARNNYGALS